MSTTRVPEPMSSLSAHDLPIALPEASESFAQDEEWCVALIDGEWRELRFHDYHLLYEVEGLYERVFYDILKCDSPRTIRSLLEAELRRTSTPADALRVLDLGAGNGIMGEELMALGAERVVGIDILPEAAEAAERDRPGVYADYHVVDMTDLEPDDRAALEGHRFTGLTCVAALGFGDIPPRAFSESFNLVAPGGWVAFNIKEDFLDGRDRSGFSILIERALETGVLQVANRKRYRHRNATNGDPLHYVAIVGTKLEDITEELIPAAD